MKKHHAIASSTILALAGLLAFGGCSSTETGNPPPSPPPPAPYGNVKFHPMSDWDTTVAPKADNVEDVTAFAIGLGRQGRHDEAARLLENTAATIRSSRNELNIRLYHSAANEYLKAGDTVGFIRSLNAAESLADVYQRTSWDSKTRRLYQLRDSIHSHTPTTHHTASPS